MLGTGGSALGGILISEISFRASPLASVIGLIPEGVVSADQFALQSCVVSEVSFGTAVQTSQVGSIEVLDISRVLSASRHAYPQGSVSVESRRTGQNALHVDRISIGSLRTLRYA